MRQQGKHGHEQSQDDRAVLGVAVQLLQEAQEAQQPDGLQEVHQGHLEGRQRSAGRPAEPPAAPLTWPPPPDRPAPGFSSGSARLAATSDPKRKKRKKGRGRGGGN